MNWEIKKLKEVCEKGSSNISQNKIKDDNGEYPIYGAKGFIKKVSFYHQNKEYISIIKDGAGIGRLNFREPFSSVIGTLQYLIPKPEMDIKYLYYFLLNIDFIKYSQGAAIPHIYFKDYSKEEILVPPLPIQKQIVKILDKTFEKISKAKEHSKQNLKNTKEVFESYLQNVFENKGEGWEEKKLNQISENLDNKRVPITKNIRTKGSIPYYGASGIVDYVAEYIFDEDLLLVSEDGANLLARVYPIAFSISGKAWVNNHAHILRFRDKISQTFVEFYLNAIKLDDFVSGMAQPKLNQTMLNKIPIPFPPIPQQKVIVTKLNLLSTETKKLESIYTQKIANLEGLKQSILQKAFKGELTGVLA